SSPDLAHWTGPAQLFDPSSYWQDACMQGSTPGWGCFRPHVLFNQRSQLYVLWVNVPSGYRALTSVNPIGPFTLASTPHADGGDMTLFADTDGSAYLIYNSARQVFETPLTADYLDVAGASREVPGFPQVSPFFGAEAPSLFARNGVYYLVLSVPRCPYCSGTGTGYLDAPTAAGPWTYEGLISDWSCDGQPTAVSNLDGVLLYQSDQWLQTLNESAANQFWTALHFDGSRILPVRCTV